MAIGRVGSRASALLMAIALAFLPACSALKPVPEQEAGAYPPRPQIELKGDQKDPRVQEASDVLQAYFSVPKSFDQSVVERLQVRSKYLSSPKLDFFYDFRTPPNEPTTEERLAALKTAQVQVIERGPVVRLKAWALYYALERTPEDPEREFFLVWTGTVDLLLTDGEWKIDTVTTDEMSGGDGHPTVSEMEAQGKGL